MKEHLGVVVGSADWDYVPTWALRPAQKQPFRGYLFEHEISVAM